MAEVKLTAYKRAETGKGNARRSRMSGRVPGIVYGRGMEPVAIEVDRREFVTALHTDAGMNVLLDIDIEGDLTLALTKDLQRDPVRGTLLHADFIKIDRSQTVDIEVPLRLVGEAPGAAEGGVLQHPLASLLVRCKVIAVPEHIDADVSSLNVGDAMRVGDLTVGEDYEILTDPDAVVASVSAPISEEQLEAMEAEAGIEAEPTDEEVAAAAAEAPAAEGETAGEGGGADEAPAEES